MDTLSAFAMGEANRNRPIRVFDWDKAATLIKEAGAQEASAGLARDWEYTGGPILAEGRPIPQETTYTYLASNWATPELKINGHTMDCWRYQNGEDDWNANTYWPESALSILNS